MKILPAIDLKGGKCVRLNKGDYKQVTHYSDNPLEMAETWMSQGTNNLHIVDLDGAKAGKPINFTIIENIRKKFKGAGSRIIRRNRNSGKYCSPQNKKIRIK